MKTKENIRHVDLLTAAKLITRAHEEVRRVPSQRLGQALTHFLIQDGYQEICDYYHGGAKDFFYTESASQAVQIFYENYVSPRVEFK